MIVDTFFETVEGLIIIGGFVLLAVGCLVVRKVKEKQP